MDRYHERDPEDEGPVGEALGVDEIVCQAGVTKPSLYRSFPSKDELTAECLKADRMEFEQWWNEAVATAGSPRKQLEALFSAFQSDVCEDEEGRGCPLANAAVVDFRKGGPADAFAQDATDEQKRCGRKKRDASTAADSSGNERAGGSTAWPCQKPPWGQLHAIDMRSGGHASRAISRGAGAYGADRDRGCGNVERSRQPREANLSSCLESLCSAPARASAGYESGAPKAPRPRLYPVSAPSKRGSEVMKSLTPGQAGS